MKKTLEEIRKEKEELQKKIRELESMERFKKSCSKFCYSEDLGEAITKLINSNEEKEYICCKIRQTFKGKSHYESTGYYEDDPSGCGGGWVETGKKLVTDPDTNLEYVVIMEQNIFDLFMKLKFTDIKDFVNNLNLLTAQGKQIIFKNNSISSEEIVKNFPYVGEFFKLLSIERYEQGKLNIDINDCLNKMLGKSLNYTKPNTNVN